MACFVEKNIVKIANRLVIKEDNWLVLPETCRWKLKKSWLCHNDHEWNNSDATIINSVMAGELTEIWVEKTGGVAFGVEVEREKVGKRLAFSLFCSGYQFWFSFLKAIYMCRDLKRMIDPMDEIKQKSHDFPVKKSWKCHPSSTMHTSSK